LYLKIEKQKQENDHIDVYIFHVFDHKAPYNPEKES